ncbi:LysR family transcriptional regulator [Bacillus sp. 03113]|uniref:LysR family transcriptional regulator n=1 Tax=Bacillus sp. 03113 TaxID=2578211 RepID=UPI00114189D1|nr:LysR family transcriptional regulator [Bacillus sp. 03113]
MDLKELRTFQTILKEGTFAKAAKNLNYAQSTITNQIQRLENEMGFKLFERGWEAKLTPSGKIFAKEIDSLIKHWEFVLDQSKALQKEEVGVLNIGVIETIATSILPTILSEFRAMKPNVSCNFIVGNTDSLSKFLRNNTIDFAIGGKPYKQDIFSFEKLYEEEISFIISKQFEFLTNDITSLNDLYKQPLFIGGENCLYHMRVEEELAQIATKPFCYTVSQLLSIPSYVHQFPSVGVVLSSLKLPNDVVNVPIKMSDPFIPIGIIQNRDNKFSSSTKQLFLEITRQEFLK